MAFELDISRCGICLRQHLDLVFETRHLEFGVGGLKFEIWNLEFEIWNKGQHITAGNEIGQAVQHYVHKPETMHRKIKHRRSS